MILLEMTSHQFVLLFRFKYFNALRNSYGTAHARSYCLFELYGIEMWVWGADFQWDFSISLIMYTHFYAYGRQLIVFVVFFPKATFPKQLPNAGVPKKRFIQVWIRDASIRYSVSVSAPILAFFVASGIGQTRPMQIQYCAYTRCYF